MSSTPSSTPTAPTPSGAAPTSGTIRTLERDVRIGSAFLLAVLFTVLANEASTDVAEYLSSRYSTSLAIFRNVFFGGSLVLIWYVAVWYIAKKIGRTIPDLLRRKQNAEFLKWGFFALAIWHGAETYIRQFLVKTHPKILENFTEFSLALAFFVAGIAVYALQKIYGPHGSGDGGKSSRGEGSYGRGRSLLYVVGLALFIAAVLAGVGWVYKAANTMPDEYSGGGRALYAPAPPPAPPAPPPPPTWHGLIGGIEKTLPLTKKWSEEIRIAPRHEITWDDTYPNVLLLVNKTNVMDLFTGTKTNSTKFETVQFKSKDGTPVTLKVATGVPKS